MLVNKIISKVRNELMNQGVELDCEMMVMEVRNNVWALKGEKGKSSYIFRYDDNDVGEEFLRKNEDLMVKYGIKKPVCLWKSERLVVYDDSREYRMLKQEDLGSREVIVGLAKLYKGIHSIEEGEAEEYSCLFSLSSVSKVREVLDLKSNKVLFEIYKNFDNIKLKLDRVKKCLNVGFSLGNILVSKDNEVFLWGLEEFCLGYRFLDVKLILQCLDDFGRELFLGEYGDISEEEELLDEVVSCVVDMDRFLNNEIGFEKCNKILSKINSDDMYRKVKCFVEWY